MEIGLIGLGNMGRNLAMHIDDRGYKLSVYNRTRSKTKSLVAERSRIVPYYSIKDMIDGMNGVPRIVILMLSSGKAVDIVLKELSLHLNSEDIVIDAGNSYFKDTIRRTNEYSFNIVGAGISGGEEGARHGASIMVGCSKESWDVVKPVLEDISTVSDVYEGKCCMWFGENGSGHFVKMIHNGIEYCDMAIISEAYSILKSMGLGNDDISELFGMWNENELQSYLLEIASKILIRKEEGKYLIDEIEDSAQQKGTGKECVVEAVELTVPAVTIVESTFSRMISNRKTVRDKLSSRLKFDPVECKLSLDSVRRCVYLCRAISYIQGFNFLSEGFKIYGWHNELSKVCDVWGGGCILRGRFLNVMKKMAEESKEDLELCDTFKDIHNNNIEDLRSVVLYSTSKGIPIPSISSCFNYINGMRTKDGNGDMIQAMRDCFGAHTVKYKGDKDCVHIEWV